MGADLITAVAVWPQGKELDWDAGRKVIETITTEEIPDHVIETIYSDGEEGSPEELAEVRLSLLAYLNDTEATITGNYRNTAIYRLLGHNVLILGDMSWGDSPEGMDELTGILDTEKVARAIGFNLDAYT